MYTESWSWDVVMTFFISLSEFVMKSCIAFATLAISIAQQKGTVTIENHPPLSIQSCELLLEGRNTSSVCSAESVALVIDANWYFNFYIILNYRILFQSRRWIHNTDGYTNCYSGSTWNTEYCPDPVSCAKNCALDGADYLNTYGVSTSGSSANLVLKTGSNVGSRLYILEVSKRILGELFCEIFLEFQFAIQNL